jgi:hypothetical protein
MNYAIDITRPRAKLAMLALGIQPQELILKSLEDFNGRNISLDVQQLRYNYYTRKLKEVIRQINSYIREEALRKMQTNVSKSPQSPPSTFITQNIEEVVDEIAEIKSKQKNKILDSFNYINNGISSHIAIEKRLQMGREAKARVQSELTRNRTKLQKYKERQLENFSRIKEAEETKANTYRYYSITPKKHKFSSVDVSAQHSRTFTEFNDNDTQIDEKMTQIDEKMERSKRIYDKSIQRKREAASRLLEKTINHARHDSADLDYERISKMIEKQKQVQARRHSFVVEQQEHRAEMRRKHELRRTVALERIKEEEKLETMRTQSIERRMEISARILKEKHDNWVKELELKNELSKLKDEEALLNAERKKRIM